MKDEIKEILDNFKIYEDRYKKCNETQFIIFYRDIHLLLDYITNLQKENNDNKKFRDELISSNTKLREEKLMYKLRIDKAIEWIYLNADYIKGRVDSFRRLDALKLLNILGGDE